MPLPTAKETAKRLRSQLGDEEVVRMRWKRVYKLSERSFLRQSFLDELRDEASKRGMIVGYGDRFVVLSRDS